MLIVRRVFSMLLVIALLGGAWSMLSQRRYMVEGDDNG